MYSCNITLAMCNILQGPPPLGDAVTWLSGRLVLLLHQARASPAYCHSTVAAIAYFLNSLTCAKMPILILRTKILWDFRLGIKTITDPFQMKE